MSMAWPASISGSRPTGKVALVEVWDENFKLPEPNQPDLDDESGRGLMLVEFLAERWGWDLPATGRGKIVWALVELI